MECLTINHDNDKNDITESIKQYMKTLKGFKALSKQEERDLFLAYKNHNDLRARNKLIESNLKYACKIASNYRNSGLNFSDLITAANDGLFTAIEKFNLDCDCKLFTYARFWMNAEIQKLFKEKSKNYNVELPTGLVDEDDEDYEISNDIIDFKYDDDIDETTKLDEIKILNDVIYDLTDKQKDILFMSYGLNYDRKYTFREIGAKYGISQETVRKIIMKSLRILRNNALVKNYI